METKIRNLFNVHSNYSLLESIVNVDQYIDLANKSELTWLSLIDHGSMFYHFAFYQQCKKQKIKPVLGINFMILFGKQELRAALIAKNFFGIQQLIKLSSHFFASEPAKISINWADLCSILKTNHLFLIAVPDLHQLEVWVEWKNKITKSYPHFYLGITEKNKLHIKKFGISDDYHLWFHPVYYLLPKQQTTYKIVQAIKNQTLLKDQNKNQTIFDLISSQFPEYLNTNAERLVRQINIQWKCGSHDQVFVTYPLTSNQSAFKYLSRQAQQGLSQKLKLQALTSKYQKRLFYELSVIKKCKFANYFLVVSDYVRFAKQKNILVGPGRGSAAASLVSYALNITDIDPIKCNLIFERFLNSERLEMPDIDVDVQDNQRHLIIQYLIAKYGADRVAYINTFQRLKFKMALRDLGRVLGVPLVEINELAKLIGDRTYTTFQTAAHQPHQVESVYWKKYEFIFRHLPLLIGLPRQTGTHAAGVIITQKPLTHYVPTITGLNEVLKTQWDMEYLEMLGLIKMDILGLTNLTVIANVLDNIASEQQVRLTLNQIPLKDESTFRLLSKGETAGIFQLESVGMTKLLVDIQPRSLDDIAITSALFRPGPAIRKDLYLKRRKMVNYVYKHPSCSALNPILQPTLGVIIFQEQVMLIAQLIAGFSLNQADMLRRAMSKKNANAMNKLKTKFWIGAQANQHPAHDIAEFWTLINRFSGYGFNRSHALAYSLIGYWMAYLKANYWVFFITALLNSTIGEEVKTKHYLKLVAQSQKISPPSVNHPTLNYVYQNQTLQLPLILIKQIGESFALQIQADVHQNGKYQDIFDLFRRLRSLGLNEQTYCGLVYSGALDDFKIDRNVLAVNYAVILNYAELTRNYAHQRITTQLPPPELTGQPLSPVHRSELEFQYLGFYLTNQPIAQIRRQQAPTAVTINQVLKTGLKQYKVIGWVNREKIIKDKNGRDMAFIDLEDETNRISLTAFASNYHRFRLRFKVGDVILAQINRGQPYRGRLSFTILELTKISTK